MSTSLKTDRLRLGVCYYPEQWPEELWEEDFRRMRETGIEVVRMAEFSWALLEPEEGRFDFSLYRRVMDLAHSFGIQVILGTPTATPPAWLTHRYPEVLNASVEGVPYRHGLRRHYNYSSPKYRELCRRIVRAMAEAYGDHPAVVGWQLDNEFNCEVNVYYAEADHAAFRVWLKERYGTLDNLNRAWGTVFWSQTYTDWEQVHLTRTMASPSPNPHLALDEKRFISANVISFAREQAEILREVAPHHWITTNGLFGHLDSHELTDELLDFFSYDSYPQFSTLEKPGDERNPLRDRAWSRKLSDVRSISPNFCVMEQQSGPGGWVNRIGMGTPRPGQIRLWSYQSILHGADLLVYFRWRTATFGTEMYWHGINDYHNRPNRRVREVAQIGKELGEIGAALAGTVYRAEVALLQDYDNKWDGELDIWHGPLHGLSMSAWYKGLQHRHIPADVVTLRAGTTAEELLKYTVIVYPHPAIMTDETARLLAEYAERGGRLLFGARTGYKDANGHCYMRPFPGAAAGLCGISVEDYTLIEGTVGPASLRWKDEREHPSAPAQGFNEILRPEADDVEIVAEYADAYYAGEPALVKRPVGSGEVWYYGAAYSDPVVEALIEELGLESPATAELAEVPAEVEIGVRESEKGEYLFMLNYSDRPAQVVFRKPATDLLSGVRMEGAIELPPYEVRVVKRR